MKQASSNDLEDYPLDHERREVVKAFEDAGIEVVDLFDSYRSYRASELWVHMVDPHPNEIARRIAAEQAARLLSIGVH